MSSIDWVVLIGATAFIILYGIWKTRKSRNMDSYLMGGNSTPWWTIGLSVMATQASAITFLSTPGQAFSDGMRFIQFYFGLPVAMVIICIFFLPRFYQWKVFTVYEYLEQRFDLRTRLLAAFLFLIQRGLGAGITIFAPAIIFSTILGWNLNLTIIIIGLVVTFYTCVGGTKAVSVTHKLQMGIMMGGILTALFMTIYLLPDGLGLGDSLRIAGASNKLNILDFSFDLDNRYTFWSGITGGTFLALAYFGTDQSQAQRYLGGQNVHDSRMGLMFNAFFKIPMQFIILMAGVMVYVFYQFTPSPVFFNSQLETKIMETPAAAEYQQLNDQWIAEQELRKNIYTGLVDQKEHKIVSPELQASILREQEIRDETKTLISKTFPEEESNDKDYVFIRFILDYLPKGVIGLLIAAILAAGMSSSSSELNALASTTTIDFYKRLIRKEATDKHYVVISKSFTVMWGLIAMGFASIGGLFENLIQFVNIV
ncbi:MAG: sodium:solute symporter, partial [Bacteroidota bacterium]|nr:sodium:solute symporter [Bacteroidota bacterium]